MLRGVARPTLDSAAVPVPTPALGRQDGAAVRFLVFADAAHIFTLLFIFFFVSCKGRGGEKKPTKRNQGMFNPNYEVLLCRKNLKITTHGTKLILSLLGCDLGAEKMAFTFFKW